MSFTKMAERAWSRAARLGYWKKYGNLLPPWVNGYYSSHARLCRNAISGVQEIAPPFSNGGPILIKQAIPRDTALSYSGKISSAIEAGSIRAGKPPIDFLYKVDKPLGILGEDFLNVFDGTLGQSIKETYKSNFRVQWLDCYRAVSGKASSSWLWHIDNHPPFVIKALIFLSKADLSNGVTRFLDAEMTSKVKAQGYFGLDAHERIEHFDDFPSLKNAGISETVYSCEPGDAVLFSANLLHKGGPVLEGYRDVVSCLMIPSVEGWRQIHNLRGLDAIQTSGGFPKRVEI